MTIRPSNTMQKENFSIRKLSMKVPDWMKPLIKQRAKQLDLTVSQYIRRLVNTESKVRQLNVVNTGMTQCD